MSSTTFPRKDIYKATWMSNDQVTRNQIDHVLVANGHRSSVLDVKSRRGADCDSDHVLVVAVVRERISLAREKRSQAAAKWNTERLKNPACEKRYQEIVKERLQDSPQRQQDTVDDVWHTVKVAITGAAEVSIGHTRARVKNPWFDEECKTALDQKAEARMRALNRSSRQATADFKAIRKKTQRLIRMKVREFRRRQLDDIEALHKRKEVRSFYRAVASKRNGCQPQVYLCKHPLFELRFCRETSI